MSSSIKDLLFGAGGNLSRPANFRIEIFFPELVNPQKTANQYDILCKNITIPETDTRTNEFIYKGSTIVSKARVDYSRVLSITFIVDENHDLIRDMITWQKGLDKNTLYPNQDIKILQKKNSIEDLLGSLRIVSKDWNEFDRASYYFDYIFPIKVGGVEFNTSDVSNIIELQVDFAFHYMKKEEDFNIEGNIVDRAINKVSNNINNTIYELNKNINNKFKEDKQKTIKKLSNLLSL